MNKQTDRALFIRAIADGDILWNEETLCRLAAQAEVPLANTGYYCIAVRYTHKDRIFADVQMPGLLLTVCEEAAKKTRKDISCYIGSQLCVLLVVLDDPEEKTALIQKLYRDISRRSQESVQFGVGRVYSQLEKLSYSQTEAYEALNSIQPASQISYIEDIYAIRSNTTGRLESEKKKIIEMFRSGQLEKMVPHMVQLAEDIRKESPVRKGMPYPTSIRRTVVEILFEIMHVSADAGVDVDLLLNHQDPYTRVFEIQGTPQILSWFHSVAGVLYRGIVEISSKTEKNMLKAAKKCIDEHLYDPELSLSMVSEVLGITATYFSAFFIQEVGMGFNEYITGLRIERAKQLLAETSKKINQIALECGFRSASYFIVVFRKQTGMSPGEYRNKK